MAILPLKSPWTINIVSRLTTLVLLVVAGHVGCCISLISETTYWLMNHNVSSLLAFWDRFKLEPFTFYLQCLHKQPFLPQLKNHIWPSIWPSSRATTVYTVVFFEIYLPQILVNWLLNCHSLWLWELKLVLLLLLYGSRSPLLWIDEVATLMHAILHKGLIGDDLLLFYDVYVTHTHILDKLRNLLLILNFPKTESEIRIISKDAIDIT